MGRVALAHQKPSEAEPRIVWPKKTSMLARDLTQKEVRAFGLDSGWVDYKICAIDEDWSGLLFARREARKT